MSFVKTLRDDWAVKPREREATPLRSSVELTTEESAEARHARRQKIRDKLLAEEVAVWRHDQAVSDQSLWEERRSRIERAHSDSVQPLEAELAAVEAQQAKNFSDEVLAERRESLLTQIREAAADRDRQLATYQSELDRLEKLRIEAAKKVPTGKRVSEKDLFDDGDKRLLARHELAKLDADHAIARFDLLQNPLLSTPRDEIEKQLERIEGLTVVRRAAYQQVISE